MSRILRTSMWCFRTGGEFRVCLVPVKCFPENTYFSEMLISEKGKCIRVFGYLKNCFTENQFRCLVCPNIFTENALHSQATQFSIHFLSCKHVDNESIPHSLTKETKPSKKIHQIRSNWDRAAEEKVRSRGGKIKRRRDRATRSSGAVLRSSRGEIERRCAAIERRDVAIDERCDAIVGLELRLWSPAKSLLPLSLSPIWALSSLSLSLSGNTLKWKWKCKMISVVKAFFFSVNGNQFPENRIIRTNQTPAFPEKHFRKWFSPKTNTPL